METRQRYIIVDNQPIPVTEEVYHAYMRPVWAEQKRQERAKRCRIGGVRCVGDCRQSEGGRTCLTRFRSACLI